MRSQENHYHADTSYGVVKPMDYLRLVKNVVEVKARRGDSLTVHLPFEIQHPAIYPKLDRGLRFIGWGERLKRLFGVNLYWENAPELNFGSWDLRHGQTDWAHVPEDIDICLDTGHLMLGAGSNDEARRRIENILGERGDQIKHLHIHENGLKSDDHKPIGEVITADLFEKLKEGRTYIFEKGA